MKTQKNEYQLTAKEKQLFSRIDTPYKFGGVRCTRPVVVAYNKDTGYLAGISSLKQWRSVCEYQPEYKYEFRFELRNVW